MATTQSFNLNIHAWPAPKEKKKKKKNLYVYYPVREQTLHINNVQKSMWRIDIILSWEIRNNSIVSSLQLYYEWEKNV